MKERGGLQRLTYQRHSDGDSIVKKVRRPETKLAKPRLKKKIKMEEWIVIMVDSVQVWVLLRSSVRGLLEVVRNSWGNWYHEKRWVINDQVWTSFLMVLPGTFFSRKGHSSLVNHDFMDLYIRCRFLQSMLAWTVLGVRSSIGNEEPEVGEPLRKS
ncbi:unnamed protein product [Vicia faba]|uniref:Uncharacterized protein n=1 Tax=Vicia faba TaxID=3906 RepID=A0AAV0ZW16_VICFA|nr:unnamed protein product [Vicia faba]